MSTVQPDGHAQAFDRRVQHYIFNPSSSPSGPPSQPPKFQSSPFMGTRPEGDIVQVSDCRTRSAIAGYLFMVPKDEGYLKPPLRSIADAFGIKNNDEVTVMKVDKQYCANYIEFTFQDQYLGRTPSRTPRVKRYLAGHVTATTKAKVTIFIQVCRKLWEFVGDGERYNEKIIPSFLLPYLPGWHESHTSESSGLFALA
ncbi:hypothetical protein BDR07DRAFT_1608847 [Suillus spraguei]|nr:hypothetical protein BDR07DRAFT_1608847 [Suillus spraguei]